MRSYPIFASVTAADGDVPAYTSPEALSLVATGHVIACLDPSDIASAAGVGGADATAVPPPLPFQAGNSAVLELRFDGLVDADSTLVVEILTLDSPAGALTDGLPSIDDANWQVYQVIATAAAGLEVSENPAGDPSTPINQGVVIPKPASPSVYIDMQYLPEYFAIAVTAAATGTDAAGTVKPWLLSN